MTELGTIWAVGSHTSNIALPQCKDGSQLWYDLHYLLIDPLSSFLYEHITLGILLVDRDLLRNPYPENIMR